MVDRRVAAVIEEGTRAMQAISPTEASERIRRGAILVDVRESGERRRSHIAGSIHQPLSMQQPPDAQLQTADVVFYCASGMRTRSQAARLASALTGQASYLDGGIQAWIKAGLPVVEDRSAPIDIMRQVMIAAGSMVLLGVALGTFVSPAFFALSAFVGAGLVFSGATGICAMARLLSLAPWNR
jgi:rhodanese-related sulfurtransferase